MKNLALSITQPNGAQIPIQGPRGIQAGGLGSFENAIVLIVGFLITLAIVFSLFMLIYAGWQWMTSSGDKQKVHQARQRITYTIIGLIVVFISFFILNVLGRFLGVNLLKLP